MFCKKIYAHVNAVLMIFLENYQNLLQHLCPNEEKKKIFDTLFNAYSIKFKGLDYEYKKAFARKLCKIRMAA